MMKSNLPPLVQQCYCNFKFLFHSGEKEGGRIRVTLKNPSSHKREDHLFEMENSQIFMYLFWLYIFVIIPSIDN